MRDKAFVSMAITTIIYSIVLIGLILLFFIEGFFRGIINIGIYRYFCLYINNGIERYLGK